MDEVHQLQGTLSRNFRKLGTENRFYKTQGEIKQVSYKVSSIRYIRLITSNSGS